MTGPINPQKRFSIPTEYKGITFRSKLEADWARFLDIMKIKWEYEPKGRYCGDIFVLCDFHLPDAKQWLEIKGRWSDKERGKYTALVRSINEKVFVGGPGGRLAALVHYGSDDVCAAIPAVVVFCSDCYKTFFAMPGNKECDLCGGHIFAEHCIGVSSSRVLQWPSGAPDNETSAHKWIADWFYADESEG